MDWFVFVRITGSMNGDGDGECMKEDIGAGFDVDSGVVEPGLIAVVRGMPGVPHGSGILTSANSFCVRASVCARTSR